MGQQPPTSAVSTVGMAQGDVVERQVKEGEIENAKKRLVRLYTAQRVFVKPQFLQLAQFKEHADIGVVGKQTARIILCPSCADDEGVDRVLA